MNNKKARKNQEAKKAYRNVFNGAVYRQPSNGQKFIRQPSKRGKIYRQPSKSQLLLAVKRF